MKENVFETEKKMKEMKEFYEQKINKNIEEDNSR